MGQKKENRKTMSLVRGEITRLGCYYGYTGH